ncbi:hypothetical protein AFLA_012499 [Aspergillus flavus NRRL3357]|nr:hypothetical protein AFLA_012499 [Aspergillus flavus NRRL3357]
MENRPSNRQGVTKPVLEVHCPFSDGTKALTNVARLPLDWCLGWNTTSLKPQKMGMASLRGLCHSWRYDRIPGDDYQFRIRADCQNGVPNQLV